ncbi:hypothetical protein TNIN_87551 [Trichonephila inaurata madagascariensis]|uniref:Uncharacterized protein n=1 Tax=Trichonephila inaurata madagascariensis TaxID=2747483 RepID=A0A8X6YHG8_9ARAC|nr:hypothetical protein TNIN_87551 [Trichonephila inaurata madagascariensis]
MLFQIFRNRWRISEEPCCIGWVKTSFSRRKMFTTFRVGSSTKSKIKVFEMGEFRHRSKVGEMSHGMKAPFMHRSRWPVCYGAVGCQNRIVVDLENDR